jgi:hypothetical protein
MRNDAAAYEARWDDDLDIWTVVDRDGVIAARGMPDRATAEDIADSMSLQIAAVVG